MRAAWWGLACLLVLAGLLLRPTVTDMCQKEIRTRLDRLPAVLVRIAIRRIPQEWREDFGSEWLAELEGIRLETGELPISGLIREILFAFGLLIRGPTIVREFTGGVSRLAAKWVRICDILFRPGSATRELAKSQRGLSVPPAAPGISPVGAISLRQPSALITIVALAIVTAVYALQPTPTAKGTHPYHAATLPYTGVLPSALDWILGQVSRAAVVSCDPQLCADLASAGFPSANMLTLGPGSNDPLGSTLVVATGPIRAHFGTRLASVYAPAVIASFGSGTARIDIRLVYPGGAATYDADQRTALRARKTAGVQLLANGHIEASATARAQLLSGDVDPRLPQLLAIMAGRHLVRIVDFTGQSPGGGPASLLRSVDLATVDSAAHLTPAAYLGWMQAFIDGQRAQYRPGSVQQVTLHTGQTVLRIGYGAPSPLS
jgi:hypothetical protein